MDRQPNDRLGWLEFHGPIEHGRKILRAIHRDANANTHGNGDPYTYLNIYANSHCDTEPNSNADTYGYTYTYTYTNVLADGNTYGYAQRFPCYFRKHFHAFARGDGR